MKFIKDIVWDDYVGDLGMFLDEDEDREYIEFFNITDCLSDYVEERLK